MLHTSISFRFAGYLESLPIPEAAAPYQRNAAVIQIANNLAYRVITNSVDPQPATESHAEAMRLLNLVDDEIPKVISQTQKSLERVQGLLTLVN